MKIGERGQVTIPKKLRVRFGLKPATEVEFKVAENALVLRKKPQAFNLEKWKGHAKKSLRELGYASVDEYIEDVRRR